MVVRPEAIEELPHDFRVLGAARLLIICDRVVQDQHAPRGQLHRRELRLGLFRQRRVVLPHLVLQRRERARVLLVVEPLRSEPLPCKLP